MGDAKKITVVVRQSSIRGTGIDCYVIIRIVNTTKVDIGSVLTKYPIEEMIEAGVEVIIE